MNTHEKTQSIMFGQQSETEQKVKNATSTGIQGFDESLGQGLPSGNLYLISGEIESNSHQFVQQILYNHIISKGKVTYYTIEHSSFDIIDDMQVLGMNIQSYVDDGSWSFCRMIPQKMSEIMKAMPEPPLEQRIDLDESLTNLMNHYFDTVKDGRSTVIHLPLLIQNFSIDEIQNLLFFMKGTVRTFGGIHFLMLTEGAHDHNIVVPIKDMVDSVFDITSTTRGSEVENMINITKIRGMIPKSRQIRLSQRDGVLTTQTIRRIH